MRSLVERLRRERGLSRRQLAQRADVTEKTVFSYEREGLDRAQLGCLVRVARALGVGVGNLFEE